MKNKKKISIICGILIIVVLITMIFRLGMVAQEFSNHPEWSLGAEGAVKITSIPYCVVISIITIVLVLINVREKK